METTGIVDPGSLCHGTVMAMAGLWCPGNRRASPKSGQMLDGLSGTRSESRTRIPRRLSTILSSSLGEPGKAHRTFLEVMLADGATETKSKPAPAKKTSNAAKAQEMSETECGKGTRNALGGLPRA